MVQNKRRLRAADRNGAVGGAGKATKQARREAVAKAPVPVIHPLAVFTLPQLTATLQLAAGTLPREIRLRRLRASKRAGRYYLLGEWIIEWLRAGELQRPLETRACTGASPLSSQSAPGHTDCASAAMEGA